MKKVIAGCIDLMLEFDSASELDRYIADIEAKKQEYSIVDRKELPGDRIMIRIHRQYNKSHRSYRNNVATAEHFQNRQILKVSQQKAMKEKSNLFTKLMGLFKKGDK